MIEIIEEHAENKPLSETSLVIGYIYLSVAGDKYIYLGTSKAPIGKGEVYYNFISIPSMVFVPLIGSTLMHVTINRLLKIVIGP
jgi:hypothetical protein